MVFATVLSSRLKNYMHKGVRWHECNAVMMHLQCFMLVRQCSAVAYGASAVPRNPFAFACFTLFFSEVKHVASSKSSNVVVVLLEFSYSLP